MWVRFDWVTWTMVFLSYGFIAVCIGMAIGWTMHSPGPPPEFRATITPTPWRLP